MVGVFLGKVKKKQKQKQEQKNNNNKKQTQNSCVYSKQSNRQVF